jgi:aminopeptidase-like protein
MISQPLPKFHSSSERIPETDFTLLGGEMHALMARLYPICRSITGNGFRETLRTLQEYIPLRMFEVPTGEQVFDWTVPKEWNIKDAYIKNSLGERVVDFRKLNLHVLNYSIPVSARLRLSELKEHLFSIPEHPDWVPYRTSYYKENWGFCVSHKMLQSLTDDTYEVCIDTTLEDGHLTYGEYVIPGQTDDEVLISCHSCHPSLCNDNLSGISLATFLAKILTPLSLRYTYRFVFIPGTIGSITWLSRHESDVHRIKHGLVVACVGDPGPMTYKKSRRGQVEIDRAVLHVLKRSGQEFCVKEFSPYGYDERQYCSPGFNLPVGSLTRTPHGQFPQYHTSADNLDFVQPRYIAESLKTYLKVVDILENNRVYLNTNPKCEPQLGKRGLYEALGGRTDSPVREYAIEYAMLWVLNMSDGAHSLLEIAERANLSFDVVSKAAEMLGQNGLLSPATVAPV